MFLIMPQSFRQLYQTISNCSSKTLQNNIFNKRLPPAPCSPDGAGLNQELRFFPISRYNHYLVAWIYRE